MSYEKGVAILASVFFCGACTGVVSSEELPERGASSTAQLAVGVDPAKELLITDLSVVNDPRRTVWKGGQGEDGPWTFGRLMMAMTGTDKQEIAADFVLGWLQEWEKDQSFNGNTAPARPAIRSTVITLGPSERTDGWTSLVHPCGYSLSSSDPT